MTPTMADRGDDFVAAWPAAISRKLNLSPEYMAQAMIRAGLATETEEHDLCEAFLGRRATRQVAGLSPDQAQAAIAELRKIRVELNEHTRSHCRYCGLPLASGECPEGCQ